MCPESFVESCFFDGGSRLLVGETRGARLARQEAVDRARRCEAERVGLTYPFPPQKRKAGKPSVQAKWEEALLRHIRVHTLLPEGVDRTVRVGWRLGCPLVFPDGAVSLPPRHESEEIIEEPLPPRHESEEIIEEPLPPRHDIEDIIEEPVPPRHDSEEIIEEPADKKAKRAKINVPLEGIACYFQPTLKLQMGKNRMAKTHRGIT